MSEATVRAQIKTILEAVDGIGVVHDYERYSRSLAKWLQLMRSEGTVNGWTIHRQATPSERDNMPTIKRLHHFKITGVYELNDATATEKTFQALLEAIYTAFKSQQTLSGTCIDSGPLQINDVDAMQIGETWYLVGECSLICHERDIYS